MVDLMSGAGDRDQRKLGFEVIEISPFLARGRKGRLTVLKIFCTEFPQTYSVIWTMTSSFQKFNYRASWIFLG